MKLLCITLLCFIFLISALQAGSIHYYDLTQRTADEVIPLIKPFLEPGEAISGEGYQLFIKATPSRANDLEGMIANIDQSLETFKISVSNDQNLLRQQNSVSGSAKIEGGDTTIQVGKHRNKDSSVEIRAESSQINNQSNQVQYLQVQEGKSAFISTANLRIIPVRNYSPRTNEDYISKEYYPVSEDGFFVTVRSPDNKTANVKI
ncbi:MAG: hypothetical protein AAF372_03745, partial [Pseudomonadota bacterium]